MCIRDRAWIEIVGIVRDARNQSLETLPQAEVFVPLGQQNEVLGTAISVVVIAATGMVAFAEAAG